jgi:nitroimidazol reductase NimA-like FMN-containing flavoprotein (pyridoxamine 5'-phosphate oxidase superfamily)
MSDKTTLRRLAERGIEDMATIHAILDEGLVCHVAYVTEGRPVVLPTLYARDGDRLLLHGSNSMGLARAVRAGSPLSVAVTHFDGLVVARSAFNSSANYRSVVIHGQGEILEDSGKEQALNLLVDRFIPGRLDDIRASTAAEIRQTSVIALPLDEVSAKAREGGPKDDASDLDSDTWAGVLPFFTAVGEPQPAPDLRPGIETPDYLRSYGR